MQSVLKNGLLFERRLIQRLHIELMVGSSIVAEGNLHSFFEESGVIHNAVVFDGINTALPDYPSKDVFAYYCPVCKKLNIEPQEKHL